MTSMIALVFAAITWTAISIAIDYARGLSLDDPTTRSWRLVARGLRLVFTRGFATLQLIAFTLAAWLAVGFSYWLLASHVERPGRADVPAALDGSGESRDHDDHDDGRCTHR